MEEFIKMSKKDKKPLRRASGVKIPDSIVEGRGYKSTNTNRSTHTIEEDFEIPIPSHRRKDKAYDSTTSDQSYHTYEEDMMVHAAHHRPKDSKLDELKLPSHNSSKSEQKSSEFFQKLAYSSERKGQTVLGSIPHVSGNEHIPQEVRGEAISTVNRFHHTPDEDTKIKGKPLLLQTNNEQLYRNRSEKHDQKMDAILLRLDKQNEKIVELQATFRDFKSELTKLKEDKNKLKHQLNEEKKDNKQRNKNILEQLANNEQRFKNISKQVTTNEQMFANISEKLANNEQRFENISEQLANNEQGFKNMAKKLTQLDTNTNEMEALHSKVDSVNQAQAVLGNSLKQTKDFIDTVKSEMKSDLAEAASQLKEGQATISIDMQTMFVKQQNLMQEGFSNLLSKMSVENSKKKKDKKLQWLS